MLIYVFFTETAIGRLIHLILCAILGLMESVAICLLVLTIWILDNMRKWNDK